VLFSTRTPVSARPADSPEPTSDPTNDPTSGPTSGPTLTGGRESADDPKSTDDPESTAAGRPRRWLAATAMVLAGLLVLFALLVPNELGRITPAAFLRLPVEAILAVAIALVLPARVRQPVAALAGLVLGLLLIVKV